VDSAFHPIFENAKVEFSAGFAKDFGTFVDKLKNGG
jgi:hypothetical protein